MLWLAIIQGTMTIKAPRAARRNVLTAGGEASSSPLEDGEAANEDDSVGKVGGLGAGDCGDNDAE